MRTLNTVCGHWYHRCLKEFFIGTKALLTLLVLSSFLFTKTAEAQTCDGSYFDVDFTHSYDPNTDKTTYTWKITDIGAPNAISHWGFDLNTCPPYTVQQFLNGAQSYVSSNGTTWSSISYVYGEDKSQNCTSGDVFKFDDGISGGGTKYYRLVVNGPWNAGIPTIYLKYGNACCLLSIPDTNPCLEEICFPPAVNNQALSLCESAFGSGTATFNLSSLNNAITGGAPNVTITWYSDVALTSVISTPSAYVSGSKTVYAKVSLNRNPTCYAVAEVILTVKPLPACGITGDNNVCPGSSNIYQATADMDSYSWSISGNGTITSATNGPSVTVLAGSVCGPYTLTVEITKDGCTNTCSQTFNASDTQAPVISTTATSGDLGCNPTAITAPVFTGLDNCDGAFTPVVNSEGPTNEGCNYTQTWTATYTDGCDNAAAPVSITYTWKVDTEAPVMSNNPPTSIEVACNTTFDNLPWVAPTWTDNCGEVIVVSTVTTPNQQQDACPSAAVYTRTWTVKDACNNEASFTQTIMVPCCSACTYTQGFYGNFNGTACVDDEDPTRNGAITIMQQALSAGPFTFGSVSNNRYWILSSDDVKDGRNSNIFKMLPGGGTPQALKMDVYPGVPQYSNTASWPVAPLQLKGPKAGQIKNSLLAQTITLFFNLSNSSNLGSIPLTSDVLITADVECGSSTPIPNTNEEFPLPGEVVDFLNNNTSGYDNTVSGLFQLANDALGGNSNGLSYSSISQAVDVINNAFDECRVLVGYSSNRWTSTASAEKNRSETASEALSNLLNVTASPNPYTDKVRFTIESPVSGQGSLEVYNLVGQKVQTVYQGYLMAGRGQSVEYTVPQPNRTTLIYVLKVGGQQVTGKLINLK